VGWMWWRGDLATIKVEVATTVPSKQVFVGVGNRSEVQSYLAGVAHDEIVELDFRPQRIVYRSIPGAAVPEPPGIQRFWQASAQGIGIQVLRWNVESGDWVLVVMNADGSRGISLTGTAGARVPWLRGVGIGLLVGGAILLFLGIALVYLAIRRTDTGSGGAGSGATVGYPLTFTGEIGEPLSPALWLVKWFLLIPHYVVLAFLWVGFCMSWLISLLAILLTGRYPRGLFAYNVGVLRWTWRVGFYSYQALGTDLYPPFTLRMGGYPADLDVAYPERLSRGLALMKWWLLALPHYAVVGLFQGGGGQHSGGGLVPLLTLFAGVALLFRGQYPRGIFEFVMEMNRWTYRVAAYASLMTDRYPPFRLGGSDDP